MFVEAHSPYSQLSLTKRAHGNDPALFLAHHKPMPYGICVFPSPLFLDGLMISEKGEQ